MLLYFVIFVLYILVFQGYLLFDEELLIFLCSFLWIDAAGGLISKLIKNYLEDKGDSIQAIYCFVLLANKKEIENLINIYEGRAVLDNNIVDNLRSYFSLGSLKKNFDIFYHNLNLGIQYVVKEEIVENGQEVIHSRCKLELNSCFNLFKSVV